MRRPARWRDRRGIATIAVTATASAPQPTRWSLLALLATGLGTTAAAVVLAVVPDLDPGLHRGVVQALCTIPPYGPAGAFLLARRPDLPFGWPR